jgi:fumarate reductase flavoprotein subunit
MGGVRVNKDGQAYNMAGLFAVGEAACWDMHGFNRLGGNSLAETLVAGRLVGASVARYASGTTLRADTGLAFDAVDAAEKRAADWLSRNGDGPSVYEIRDAMGEIMMTKVGIFRNAEELGQAVTELNTLLASCDDAVLQSKGPGANPELAFALRIKGMLRLAITAAAGALARTESRGAHCRVDYPLRNDEKWLNRTLAHWPLQNSSPMLGYEPTGLMQVPPGHRGYGSDERIEMTNNVSTYNETVLEQQSRHGRLATEEAMGSRQHSQKRVTS